MFARKVLNTVLISTAVMLFFAAGADAVTKETLELGIWGLPCNSQKNQQRFAINSQNPDSPGGLKNIIFPESKIGQLRQSFASFSEEEIKKLNFYTHIKITGDDVGIAWDDDSTMCFNDGVRGCRVVNEWVLVADPSSISVRVDDKGTPEDLSDDEYIGEYAIRFNHKEGLQIFTPTTLVFNSDGSSHMFNGRTFRELVQAAFDRHHRMSEAIYALQPDGHKRVAGIKAGGDQQAGSEFRRAERFHSLLRAFAEGVRLHNRDTSDPLSLALANLDEDIEVAADIPPLIMLNDSGIKKNIECLINGDKAEYQHSNLLPTINAVGMYSHVAMRSTEMVNLKTPANPFTRLQKQILGANTIFSRPAKRIHYYPQAHHQDWYLAALKRMPQLEYEGPNLDAMNVREKAWAFMYPDGQMIINQFYYGLASGASRIFFYTISDNEHSSLDDDDEVDASDATGIQCPFGVPTRERTGDERDRAIKQLLWEVQNLKNMPRYILERSDFESDEQYTARLPFSIVSSSSQKEFQTVRIQKKVVDVVPATYHDILLVFYWDQSDPIKRTYIYTHPNVIRRNYTFDKAVNHSTLNLDGVYSAIYRWEPHGLTRVAKVRNPLKNSYTFALSKIRVSEDRPLILIGVRKDAGLAGTPYDDGSAYDLVSLYHPYDIVEPLKQAMVERIGAVNTDGIANGTLLGNMKAISGFNAPTIKCYKTRVESVDTLRYFSPELLVNNLDDCPSDDCPSDYYEAMASLQYLDYKRRQAFVGDGKKPAFAAANTEVELVVGDFPELPEISTDCSVTRTLNPEYGENGCQGGTRQLGSFSFLYKKWNYYTRFREVLPDKAYASRPYSTPMYWLDQYKIWHDCTRPYMSNSP
jgi:hypothetical protein